MAKPSHTGQSTCYGLSRTAVGILFLLKHGLATRTLNMNMRLFLLVLVCLSSSDHARAELVDPQLCCLHIFAAVSTNMKHGFMAAVFAAVYTVLWALIMVLAVHLWVPFSRSRTKIKGGGLQAISSSQFSVPAFGSKNFLDPRKLLRTVLSGF